jgi:hypothetical protein
LANTPAALGTETLDELWDKLSLDSLVVEAQPAFDVTATLNPAFQDRTVRRSADPLAVTDRIDFPQITLAPPAAAETSPEKDLEVIGLLGEGGMGRVLLARQHSLGREVAVKVIRGTAPQASVQALLAEARTTGGLEHPGVVPVYALASVVDGGPALVMKRVDGVAWSTLLRDPDDAAWDSVLDRAGGRLETHLDILLQVCNAIAFAHRRGVIHRDVKPANVLVGEFGEVYVADWGVATKALATVDKPRPSLVGTPCYMAPEMVTGEASLVDERTDVFLVGATLFEVLSGHPPWTGLSLREVLHEALLCRPKPLPQGTPEELARICLKALSPRKEDRYQTALELRGALADYLRHRGSVELATAARERLAALETLLGPGAAKDRQAIYATLSECRFGFRAALREWPENATAREGLRAALTQATRYEIAERHPAAARALLNELTPVPAELEAEVAALEAEDTQRAARERRLSHLANELDPTVSQRQRMAFVVVIALATAVLVALRNLDSPVKDALDRAGPWSLVFTMGTGSLIVVLSLFFGRRWLWATRINRSVTGLVGAAILGAFFHRVLALQMGTTPAQTMVGDLVLMSAASAVGGFAFNWGFAASAVALAAGAVGISFWPEAASPLFGATTITAMLAILLGWRRWKSDV